MTIDWETAILLATTIGGLGTTIVLVYRARAEKNKLTGETGKLSAETAAVISNSALLLLEPMRIEITSLEGRIKSATERADRLERHLAESTIALNETTRKLEVASKRIDELLQERVHFVQGPKLGPGSGSRRYE